MNFSANKIEVIPMDHNLRLYSFIFNMKNIKTSK